MSGQFAGKTVAITGAAGGIGQWLCRFFGAEGATIAALDRSDKVNGLVEALGKDGIKVLPAVADIASADQVKAAFAGFGDVHLLINNAGVSRHPTLASPIRRAGKKTSRPTSTAPMPAPMPCCRRWWRAVPARSSMSARSTGCSALGDPAYSAAKAGMIAMTKAIAMEYGRYGIRANCVLPGTVRTPIWDQRKAKDPNVLKQLERWYPLGRIVEPDEVARVIAFLASDAASAVTGVALPVDCGLTAGNIVMARELTVEDF